MAMYEKARTPGRPLALLLAEPVSVDVPAAIHPEGRRETVTAQSLSHLERQAGTTGVFTLSGDG